MRRLHIFRAGKRTDSAGLTLTYSEADLAGIAATYDPALHEAPIVVGHPRLDAPAYGWIRGVAAQGEELQAEPHQVETTFSEMVQAGRFKHISAAFYLPESPSHPIRKSGGEPQFPYLKHVGFLGAAAPAVPGLKPVEFSAQEEGVAEFASDLTTSWVARLVRGLREWMIAKHGMEDADQVVPPWMADELVEEARRDDPLYTDPTNPTSEEMKTTTSPAPNADRTAEYAERESQLAERERKLAEQEQQMAERTRQASEQERRRRHEANVAFAEGLADDNGRILPVDIPIVAAALDVVDQTEGATVTFGEGDAAEAKPLGQAVRDWLKRVPQPGCTIRISSRSSKWDSPPTRFTSSASSLLARRWENGCEPPNGRRARSPARVIGSLLVVSAVINTASKPRSP